MEIDKLSTGKKHHVKSPCNTANLSITQLPVLARRVKLLQQRAALLSLSKCLIHTSCEYAVAMCADIYLMAYERRVCLTMSVSILLHSTA